MVPILCDLGSGGVPSLAPFFVEASFLLVRRVAPCASYVD